MNIGLFSNILFKLPESWKGVKLSELDFMEFNDTILLASPNRPPIYYERKTGLWEEAEVAYVDWHSGEEYEHKPMTENIIKKEKGNVVWPKFPNKK